MPDVQFTEEDFKRSTKLAATWYRLKITAHKEEPAKSDGGQSMNDVVDFVTVGGKTPGVPIRRFFSEKAPGFSIDFFNAITGGKAEAGKTYRFGDAVGLEIDGYCQYNAQRKNNEIVDFRAAQS